jgi:hypothetical protein
VGSGSHEKPRRNLQEIKWMAFIFLQIQPSPIRKLLRQIKGLRVFQRGLKKVCKLTLSPPATLVAGDG